MSDITIKCSYNGDLRRWSTFAGQGAFERIIAKTSECFSLDPKAICLRYVDNDGDLISIMADRDLDEALSQGVSTPRGCLIRLEVSTTDDITEFQLHKESLEEPSTNFDDDLEGLSGTPAAPGTFARLVDVSSGARMEVTGCTLPNGRVILKVLGQKQNVAMGPKGFVSNKGGEGPWAQFSLISDPTTASPDVFFLANHGNRDKGWSLGFDQAKGTFALSATTDSNPWRLVTSDGSPFALKRAAGWYIAKCAAKQAKKQAEQDTKEKNAKAEEEKAQEKAKKQETVAEAVSLAPGRYKIRTAGHTASRQPAGWGLAAFRFSKEDGIRNGHSTFVSVHDGNKWPHEWDISPGAQPGTYKIRTAGHASSKQPAGWGLSAFHFSKQDGIRNGASTFVSIHDGDKWPQDWVFTRGTEPGTIRILTAGHGPSKQPAGWGLGAFRFSKKDCIRNHASTYVTVHAGDEWPSNWVLEQVSAPAPIAVQPLVPLNKMLATIQLAGNYDGRDMAKGHYLAVHGSQACDTFDKNAFWSLATSEPGKASIWCIQRGHWIPDGLVSLSVAGNLDGRTVGQEWSLMLSSQSRAPHKRDGASAYTLVTRPGNKKGGLWAVEPWPEDASKCTLKYMGNRDGRKDGMGWYLAVHGSRKSDKRDSKTQFTILTKEARKASLWDIRAFWGQVPAAPKPPSKDSAGNPHVGFHKAKKAAVPGVLAAFGALVSGKSTDVPEPTERSAAAAIHSLRVAAEWLKAKTGLPIKIDDISNAEALNVVSKLRELPQNMPKWAAGSMGKISCEEGAKKVDAFVAALGGGMEALWDGEQASKKKAAMNGTPQASAALYCSSVTTKEVGNGDFLVTVEAGKMKARDTAKKGQWLIQKIPDGDGAVRIVSKQTGGALYCSSVSTKSGKGDFMVTVDAGKMKDRNTKAKAAWQIQKQGDGTVKILSLETGGELYCSSITSHVGQGDYTVVVNAGKVKRDIEKKANWILTQDPKDGAYTICSQQVLPTRLRASLVSGIDTTIAIAAPGVKLWKDRDYVIGKLPKALSGATLFQGPHKAIAKNSVLSISTSAPSTVFLAFEQGARSGGFGSLQGWDEAELQLMSWGKKDSCNSKLVVYSKTVGAETITLPATSTSQTVMSILVAQRPQDPMHKTNPARSAAMLPVHQGIWCDNCKVTPIVGDRFWKQLPQDTYDICGACYAQRPDQEKSDLAIFVKPAENSLEQTTEAMTAPPNTHRSACTVAQNGTAATVPTLDLEALPAVPGAMKTVEINPLLEELAGMGFDRPSSTRALEVADGKFEMAVEILCTSNFSA